MNSIVCHFSRLSVELINCDSLENAEKIENLFKKSLPFLEDFIFYLSHKDSSPLFDDSIKGVELSVTFCDEAKIQSLNLDYREKNKKTDVLSFPIYENLRENDLEKGVSQVEMGDIFICSNVAQMQAQKFSIEFEQEIMELFIHGFLHLLGFDHEISKEEEVLMENYQSELIKKIF